MSRNVELPDDVYSRIEAQASTTGSTVAEWIEATVPKPFVGPNTPVCEQVRATPPVDEAGQPPHTLADSSLADSPIVAAGEGALPAGARTMADRLAGLIGTIDSGGREAIAARPENAFSDYLIENAEAAGDAMSKSLELPEDVYTRVEEVASAVGSTVAEVIAARFPESSTAPVANGGGEPPRTLADRFEGLIGVVSLDRTDLAERHGELFAEGMEEKYRQGRL